MALLNCGDCNALVSSAATACPRCGAPPDLFRQNSVRRAKPYLIAVGSCLVGAVVTLVAVIAYGLHHAVDPQADEVSTSPIPAPTEAREAARGHANFVVERNGDYGYQLASDKTGSDLTFFRYLGTSKHTTRFAEVMPGRTIMFSCDGMCDQVTAGQYVNGRIVGQTTINVEGGTLLYAVIEDIIQARVKLYKAPKT